MPLTTREVARILGFHEKAISCAIRSGLLKASRFGHVWMIDPDDLREYVANHPQQNRLAHAKLSEIGL
jgi:excisionase family DNA binding protein